MVWIRSLPFIPEVPCSKLLTADRLYGLYTSVFSYQALANCLLFHPMKCLTPRSNTLWDTHCAHRLVGKSYLYEAGSSSPSPSLDYVFLNTVCLLNFSGPVRLALPLLDRISSYGIKEPSSSSIFPVLLRLATKKEGLEVSNLRSLRRSTSSLL